MTIAYLNRARNAALAAILAAGLTIPAASIAYADDTDSGDTSIKVRDKLNNLVKDDAEDENAPKKTESVYVFANADGSVKNTVVTNWLNNPNDAKQIYDISSLSDIQNTEGEETFTAKGQSLAWNAEGNDIYYQGTTDKKAPIELKVTYWLDGKETAPADMAGKSGHVKIRFDYKNTSFKTEYVDGAARTVYTPFVCVTGLILDNNICKNISTKNAKALNDGDRTMVGGYALPGLKEDLGLDNDDFEIPDFVEIEADVQNFEMGTTATLVSSSLLNSLNTDELDTDEIGDSLNQLSDAMGQLIDGTSQLYRGMAQLDAGGEQLADGAKKLSDKTADLPKSVKKLADGSAKLADGTDALANGTSTLADGTEKLSGGSDELAQGLASAVDGNAQLIAGNEQITDGLGDAITGASNIKEGIDAARKGLDDGSRDSGDEANDVLDAVVGAKGGVDLTSQNLKDAAGDTTANDQLAALEGSLSNAENATQSAGENLANAEQQAESAAASLDAFVQSETFNDLSSDEQAQLTSALDALTNGENGATTSLNAAAENLQTAGAEIDSAQASASDLGTTVQALKDGFTQAANVLDQVSAALGDDVAGSITTIADGLDQLSTGSAGLSDGLQELEGGSSQLGTGLQSLNDGLSSASEGADALSDGASKLNSGAKNLDKGAQSVNEGAGALAEGLDALNKAAPTLKAGISALKDGSTQLSDGIGSAKDGTGKLKKGLETLNSEGIQKIIDAYNDNLAGLSDRLKATVDAGKAYDTFSGKSSDMKGSVKFIYETDAIELPDDK